MNFFKSVAESTYNFAWLRTRRGEPKKAWAYAILFILVITIIQFVPGFWQFPKFAQEFRTAAADKLPDFTAQFKNGELYVTGLAQPYIQRLNEEGKPDFLLVIDTTATSTPGYQDYITGPDQNIILITKTGFSNYTSRTNNARFQGWQVFSNALGDRTFTKADLVNGMNKYAGLFTWLFVPVVILVMFVFTTIGKLIYLAAVALVVKIIAAIGKRPWKFGEIYTVGLFALTLPTALQVPMFYTGFRLPFIYSAVLLTYLLIVIFGKGDAAAGGQPPVPTSLPPTPPSPPPSV